MAKKRKSSNPARDAANVIVDALAPLEEAERQAAVNAALTLLNMASIGGVTARIVGSSQPPSATAESRTLGSGRAKSLVELVQEKAPASNPQFIAVFAYYRERHEGISRFSPASLKEYFAKAKQPKPQNYARDFREAVRNAWIHEDGEESYITSKGLESVESGFGGKRNPRGRLVKRKKKKPSKASA